MMYSIRKKRNKPTATQWITAAESLFNYWCGWYIAQMLNTMPCTNSSAAEQLPVSNLATRTVAARAQLSQRRRCTL